MFMKWNEISLANYDKKVSALISEFSKNPSACRVHIGISNSKTDMVNEGTSAGICGTCDCSCKGDCRETCYAIVHGDGMYTRSRTNHAKNTVFRRNNPYGYYMEFFKYAEAMGKSLRVNETGDFESVDDIQALYKVAVLFPSVRVIGYTKRLSLLSHIAELNKLPNVKIHYSLAFCGNGKAEAENLAVPYTSITLDETRCNCPSQIYKKQGKVWHCSQCAERGIGCFSKQNIYFLAH